MNKPENTETPTADLPPVSAADVAADVMQSAPQVSDRAGEIEKQLTGAPPVDPEAPYGRLKNGKPRKSPPRERDQNRGAGSVMPDDRMAKRRESAAAIVDTVTGTLGAVFDPDEWKPSDTEHRALTDATARYMDSRNLDDLPPGVALVVAFSLYAIPRMVAKEKTRGKMSAVFGWFGKLWKGKK